MFVNKTLFKNIGRSILHMITAACYMTIAGLIVNTVYSKTSAAFCATISFGLLCVIFLTNYFATRTASISNKNECQKEFEDVVKITRVELALLIAAKLAVVVITIAVNYSYVPEIPTKYPNAEEVIMESYTGSNKNSIVFVKSVPINYGKAAYIAAQLIYDYASTSDEDERLRLTSEADTAIDECYILMGFSLAFLLLYGVLANKVKRIQMYHTNMRRLEGKS